MLEPWRDRVVRSDRGQSGIQGTAAADQLLHGAGRAGGVKAVIVYGKNAPWTQKAAQTVRKAIEDWSGAKLNLADDGAVTSDETCAGAVNGVFAAPGALQAAGVVGAGVEYQLTNNIKDRRGRLHMSNPGATFGH